MTGLQKLCKLYGSIKVGTVTWVWDSKLNKAVIKKVKKRKAK